jgi:flavin-binding protein dodecin
VAVIKTIDLVGVSTESWQDAATKALVEAAKTIRGIQGFDVLETSAVVDGSEISEIRFRIERS